MNKKEILKNLYYSCGKLRSEMSDVRSNEMAISSFAGDIVTSLERMCELLPEKAERPKGYNVTLETSDGATFFFDGESVKIITRDEYFGAEIKAIELSQVVSFLMSCQGREP